jgi:hypothetical protein
MIYQSECKTCKHIYEYSAPASDWDKTPSCCNSSTERVILDAPLLSPMIWTSHKATMVGGKWCETASDYKRVMKEGNYISSAEGREEAAHVKKHRAKKEEAKLLKTVLDSYDQAAANKRPVKEKKPRIKKAA